MYITVFKNSQHPRFLLLIMQNSHLASVLQNTQIICTTMPKTVHAYCSDNNTELTKLSQTIIYRLEFAHTCLNALLLHAHLKFSRLSSHQFLSCRLISGHVMALARLLSYLGSTSATQQSGFSYHKPFYYTLQLRNYSFIV